jgi:hypothetical protein
MARRARIEAILEPKRARSTTFRTDVNLLREIFSTFLAWNMNQR